MDFIYCWRQNFYNFKTFVFAYLLQILQRTIVCRTLSRFSLIFEYIFGLSLPIHDRDFILSLDLFKLGILSVCCPKKRKRDKQPGIYRLCDVITRSTFLSKLEFYRRTKFIYFEPFVCVF